MRPEFTEHKVLHAADLEDERAYLDEAWAGHLECVHGTRDPMLDDPMLVAARVAHPEERAAIGFALGPSGTALTVSTAGAGVQTSERVRVAPAAQPALTQLVFSRSASAPATGAAPGTVSLLEDVGEPAATELRIEAPGRKTPGRVVQIGRGAKRLSIGVDGTVVADDLTVTGDLALGPPPASPGPASSDPTGSIGAAEALRRQLAQGLGIGADVGLDVVIANVAIGGGRVRFNVEVTGAPGVAPLNVTIRGRVNVGAVAADDVAFVPAQLQAGQVLPRAVDVAIPSGATGDVIAAVTAYGVHPQLGLVHASEARLLGAV